MAAQEVLQARIQEEAEENLARVAQHHDERHQRPARPADRQMAEVSPIDLALFAGQAAQAQIGLGLRAGPVTGDDMAEVAGAAAVAALPDHGVQTAGGQRRERLQGLVKEGQIRVDPGRPRRPPDARQAGLGQHPGNSVVVHVQLPGDGPDEPLLNVVIAQDLRLEIRGDGHEQVLCGHAGRSNGLAGGG
jgi:hypothetical protein